MLTNGAFPTGPCAIEDNKATQLTKTSTLTDANRGFKALLTVFIFFSCWDREFEESAAPTFIGEIPTSVKLSLSSDFWDMGDPWGRAQSSQNTISLSSNILSRVLSGRMVHSVPDPKPENETVPKLDMIRGVMELSQFNREVGERAAVAGRFTDE
jgi:hypothetical protein